MNAADQLVGMLLEDEDWKFTSSLELNHTTDVYGLPQDQSMSSGKAEIVWSLDIDARSYGVKELTPIIRSIQVNALLDDYSSEEQVELPFEIVYNSEAQPERPADESDPKAMAQFYDGFTAEAKWNPARQADHTHIYPTSLEIDVTRRHIIVHFG